MIEWDLTVTSLIHYSFIQVSKDGQRRNSLAGHQPTILRLQAQVSQNSQLQCPLILIYCQNYEKPEFLSQRVQCHRPLQPPVMSPGQFPLRHRPLQPRHGRTVPLHQDHRARPPAVKAVGAGQAVAKLCQSAGTDRLAADLLAQVPGTQVQAASHAVDPGGDSHATSGQGGGTAR